MSIPFGRGSLYRHGLGAAAAALLAFSGHDIASARPVRETFTFPNDPSLRMELTLNDDRSVAGALYRTDSGTQAAGVRGTNPHPGVLVLR
jgi:hypothetical protein